MAYRRRHPSTTSTSQQDWEALDGTESFRSSSLAAKAIRASSAHRDSSLSSVYYQAALPPAPSSSPHSKDAGAYEYTSIRSLNERKHGLWGTLARKAKVILEDDNGAQQPDARLRPHVDAAAGSKYHSPHHASESQQKTNSPKLQKGLGVIASSLNSIGGAIGNALEGGLTKMENRTADIIQETRKLHVRKKGDNGEVKGQARDVSNMGPQTSKQIRKIAETQTDVEIQLKASRDVAMAMAAKAKLLLRELKTLKADLAFARERCAQLEEECRILRENRDSLQDDDLVRLQLETLLAEKARLAQENSVYARENRFLREVVEYHQLTMQDVVYLNEGTEEVEEILHPAMSRCHQ